MALLVLVSAPVLMAVQVQVPVLSLMVSLVVWLQAVMSALREAGCCSGRG